MKERVERPDMRFERLLWATCAVGSFIAIDVLTYRITQAGGQPQTWQFAGVGLGALLLCYAVWMLWQAWSLRYVVRGAELHCRQGPRRLRLRLRQNVRLVRWRERWSFGTSAETELGVEQVHFFPSFWLGRPGATWVLIHEDKKGRPVALVFRPSPEMIELIRTRVNTEEPLVG